MPLTSNEGLYSRYRKALLSTERVRELSRPAPVRVVADTVACWIAIFAAWYLVAILGTWWSVAVAIPIIGNRYYALFILGHDGMHRRLFERPGPNDLFCDLFLLGPIGAITRINNRNHLGHHHHLASDEDPDRVRHACFNKATVPETVAFLSGLTTLLPIVHNVFMPNRAGDLEPSKGKARERPTVAYRARDLLIVRAIC